MDKEFEVVEDFKSFKKMCTDKEVKYDKETEMFKIIHHIDSSKTVLGITEFENSFMGGALKVGALYIY